MTHKLIVCTMIALTLANPVWAKHDSDKSPGGDGTNGAGADKTNSNSYDPKNDPASFMDPGSIRNWAGKNYINGDYARQGVNPHTRRSIECCQPSPELNP